MITRTDAIILKTKITLPFPKDSLVERERLLQSLSGGVHGRLTLIYAPAGSAKPPC